MAEQFIYPEALTVRFATPTIVGSPPQHADGSDATYATYFRHGAGLPDRTRAALPATVFAGEVISFEVRYRASTSTVNAGIGIGFISTGFSFPLIADGAIRDYVQNIDALLDVYFEDFVAELEAGSYVELNAVTTGPITVYEFAVVALLADTAVAYLPHARLEPRSDGGGGPLSTRLFPVKSEQHTPRFGPGSYY